MRATIETTCLGCGGSRVLDGAGAYHHFLAVRADPIELHSRIISYTLGSVPLELEGVKLADLQQLMPDYPRSYVQSVLRKLRKDGKIRSEGTTSSARWFAVVT